MKGVELVHISSKTWWEEVGDTDNAGISLVSNYSTSSTNNIMLNTESCNNFLESCYIIVGEIQRNKMMRAMI